MSLYKFKTYNLAVSLHRAVEARSVPQYLRDQLLRATSSVVLNVAEGSGKITPAEKRRYFSIAMGSLREAQAAIDLARCATDEIRKTADQLAACLWRLCHPK
jgi:four helix bundle protein